MKNKQLFLTLAILGLCSMSSVICSEKKTNEKKPFGQIMKNEHLLVGGWVLLTQGMKRAIMSGILESRNSEVAEVYKQRSLILKRIGNHILSTRIAQLEVDHFHVLRGIPTAIVGASILGYLYHRNHYGKKV